MLGTCLENVRNTVPLVHNITNYVTVNDVANILLACGGSPIMSDEPEDVEDITSICGGLNINIGTLNQRSIEGMFRAGAKANALGHVVLLDPVGAGASALRTNTAVELMEKIKFTVIRGNISARVSLSASRRAAARREERKKGGNAGVRSVFSPRADRFDDIFGSKTLNIGIFPLPLSERNTTVGLVNFSLFFTI